MKQLFLVSISILFLGSLYSQTTIFGENFESGGANWTLNTTDEGGIGSDALSNQWMINNVYSSIWGVTPNQPVEIADFPQSNYLHIGNGVLTANNAIYLDAASQPVFGGTPGLNFVRMNGDISTVGFTNVHLSFYWLDQGNLGKAYYSIDSGTTWIAIGGDFNGQSIWSLFDLADAALDNQLTLRLGFSFDNTQGAAVADPPFAIDDILLYMPGEASEDPVASFTPSSTSICVGESITFTDNSTVTGVTTYDWAFENGTPATANTIGPHTVEFNTVGSFDITLTVTDENGSDTETIEVNVLAASDATITDAGPFCTDDSSLLLSAVDGGGSWSGTGIVNSSTGSFAPNIAGVGSHIITHTIPGSCGDTQTTTIEVAATADATITPVGPFCAADDIVFLAAVDGGGTWSGTGITNAATGAFDPSAAAVGNNDIAYTITGTCGDTNTITISITAVADASITAVGPFCTDDSSLLLTAVDAGGTWSGTGIVNASSGAFDPNTAGEGIHTITYTIAGSCGDTQTTSIEVTDETDATITPVGPFCADDALVFLIAVDGGGTWSGTGISNTSTGAFDPSLATIGNNDITYTIAGSCGDSNTITISVVDNAEATITPAGPFCLGDANMFLAAVDGGGVWSGNGIIDAATGEFDPSAAVEGDNTITYTISGTCGDSDFITISVTSSPDASIDEFNDPICENGDSVFLVAATSGGTWDGTGINTLTGEFSPVDAGVGTHIITYTVSSSCGNAEDSIEITVQEVADASFSVVADLCENSGVFQLVGDNTGGGTWSGTGMSATGEFDPMAAGVGTHEITYTISGDCGDSQSMNIIVEATDDATILSLDDICITDLPVDFVAQNSGGTWSGNGIVNVNSGTFDPSVAGVGTHEITYTIVSECGDSQSTFVVVTAFINANISTVDPLCDNDDSIPLSAENEGGLWSGDGVVGFESGVFSPSVAGVGTHTITYFIPGSCGDSQSIDIVVNASVNVSITAENITCIDNGFVQLTGSPFGGIWTGEGILDEDTGEFDPNVTGEGTYIISYQLDDLCQSNDFHSITVDLCADMNLYLPTAFSPNGDDQNDVLFVRGNGIKTVNLVVFDRWGEEVFSTSSLTIGWDGTFKGSTLNPATFYYSLVATMVDGSKINRNGSILLSK